MKRSSFRADRRREMTTVDALKSASNILAAGRKIQTGQLRAISENIANAESTATVGGGDPYRRKIATFTPIVPDSEDDPVGRIVRDTSDFRRRYAPGDPLADASGSVKLPNVNTAVEFTHLQTTIRAYELNLSASSAIDRVSQATIDLLK